VTPFLRHREKVLAHATEQLACQGRQHPADLLTLYKKFLKIENHRLRLKHYAGGGGREIAQQRADLIDIMLRHLYESALAHLADRDPQGVAPSLALVAIGGYGRGELSPYSDVDIMFLHEGPRIEPQAEEVIESILYMLWDVGFKVGHASRSVAGAIAHANVDMLSKTALLESRLIVGSTRLFDEFQHAFEKKCIKGHEKEYTTQRVLDQAARHAKHGSTVYMQEPNIKTGCGSLRDYQNLLWIAFFRKGARSTSDLVTEKLLPESERRKLDRAYDFLLWVRTELHYLCRRGTDTLNHVHQLPVASRLGYPQKNPLRRIEAFMRDYYHHARVIYQITETLSAKLCLSEEESAKNVLTRLLMRKKKNEHFDGFFVAGGQLYPEAREIFKDDPFRMMRAFQHAQQRKVVFSPELQALIRRRLHLVDRTYCYARSARETFGAILRRKGEVGRIVRMMHEHDFLGRYIPEFGELTCLVQHEFFHRYTADQHTLVCIEKLDELLTTDKPRLRGYRQLFERLDDPFVLYLALLLHDTGKASNARYHAEASAIQANRVAARLQLRSQQRKELIFLVDNHLLLSSTAQRRNLEDPATISEFANVVRTQANLNMLMLLTLVDGMAIGDGEWSDWKESLVWHLYESTTQYFKDGVVFFHERAMEREENRRVVLRKLAPSFEAEVGAHFLYMPDSYFQAFDTRDIAGHIRLFRTFFEQRLAPDAIGLAPAIRWVTRPERGHSELWVCTWDRRHLLAKIAGSLAAARLNILSADIFTRGDNLVLDVFRVCDTSFQAVVSERDTALVEETLTEALTCEEFDFTPLLEKAERGRGGDHLSQELEFPTRISIDPGTHPVYTLVDIQTPDRLGLLYYLLKAFGEAGVNIALSRIATDKGAAIDSFYVTNREGRKIKDRESIHHLQKLLEKVTERPHAPEEPVDQLIVQRNR